MLMPSLTRLSLWFAALMFPVVASAAPAAPQPELRTVIDQALRTSAQQYEWMLEHLPTQERMPRTLEKGKLVTVRERDWTVGFFPGTLWYLYEGTQRPSWRAAAERLPASAMRTSRRRSSRAIIVKADLENHQSIARLSCFCLMKEWPN